MTSEFGEGRTVDETFIKTGLDSSTVKFQWEIQHFNMIRKAGSKIVNKQRLELSTGDPVASTWVVALFSTKQKRKQWVGIFNVLETSSTFPVVAVFHVKIRGKSGSDFYYDLEADRVWEKPWEGVYGWHKFIKEKYTRDDKLPLLDNGSLLIEGEIQVMKVSESKTEVRRRLEDAEQVGAATLVKDLETFLKQKEGLGVVKIVSSDGKEFFSNKVILSARSSVFASMFTSGMQEDEKSVVEMNDSNGTTVAVMLAYVHSGKFLKEVGFSSADEIANVAYVAEKYDLRELHEYCDKMMTERWDRMRAEESLELAKKLNLKNAAKEIEGYAMKYLRMKK